MTENDLVESMDQFDDRMIAKLARAGVIVERTKNGFQWTFEKLGTSGVSANFGDMLSDLFTLLGVKED